MLRHSIVVANAIPMLGEKMPQTNGDHPVLLRQRPQHRIPGAEIAERAVYADQRRISGLSPADLKVGHVVSVDVKSLHATPGDGGLRMGEADPELPYKIPGIRVDRNNFQA